MTLEGGAPRRLFGGLGSKSALIWRYGQAAPSAALQTRI
jgi:hypothetical protein